MVTKNNNPEPSLIKSKFHVMHHHHHLFMLPTIFRMFKKASFVNNIRKQIRFNCKNVILAQSALVMGKFNKNDVEENIGQLMGLARTALERNEIDKAVAILEMGLKISEEYEAYYVMPYMYDVLISIAFAVGDFKKAEILLVQVIEKMLQLGIKEDSALMVDFKLKLSRIYSNYDENYLAEIGFRNCLNKQLLKIKEGDTSPQTGMLYVNTMFWYGLHKIKEKDFKTAKDYVTSAYNYSLQIKGLNPYQEMIILYTLADINFELGEYDVAVQNLQSAISLGKGIGSLDLPKCYLKLGKIYKKINSIEMAQKWFKEAEKLAKLFNDTFVLEDLKNLK